MSNKKLSVSMIKDTVRQRAQKLMMDYSTDKAEFIQEHTIAQVFSLQMLCIALRWDDLDKELNVWIDKVRKEQLRKISGKVNEPASPQT